MNSPVLYLTSAFTAVAAAVTLGNAVPEETVVDALVEAPQAIAADIAVTETEPEPLPVPAPVPSEYTEWIFKASAECDEINPGHLAAQIFAESSFTIGAVSYANAQGPAQFTPETWEAWGADGDGDGIKDPFSIADAVTAQARYMCHNIGQVNQAIADGKVHGDPIELALAAYNAGFGAVLRFGGMPEGGEYSSQTQPYVKEIRDLESAYTDFLNRLV